MRDPSKHPPTMTLRHLAFRGLQAGLVPYLAVGLGVAVATAVLTGAFVVGDSVRGSLRALALGRLGQVDYVLLGQPDFRQELASEWLTQLGNPPGWVASSVLMTQATLESTQQPIQRVAQVQLMGIDAPFGQLDAASSTARLDSATAGTVPTWDCQGEQILLNGELAAELGVKAGDEILLRVGIQTPISADSPLGKKSARVNSRRLTVARVLTHGGLAHFGLSPAQQLPKTAFVSRSTAQDLTEQPGRANVLLLGATAQGKQLSTSELASKLPRNLSDQGLKIVKSPRGYWNLTSPALLLPDAVENVVHQLEPDASRRQPVLAYLANALEVGPRELAYATVAGVEVSPAAPLGPFLDSAGQPLGPIGDDEIVLTDWAAARLQAVVGSLVTLRFFEPESTHGETVERTPAPQFKVKAIIPLVGAVADPEWVPEVQGITDQASIADWDPPFPFDLNRVTKEDEAYWDDHRATPKAFVSLATARKLWASRFGQTTSVRVNSGRADFATDFLQHPAADPTQLGLQLRPLRQEFTQAAAGTTPFEGLFLGFSMFVIAAALILVALLFRLAMEQRGTQLGVYMALGLTPGQVGRLVFMEVGLTALIWALLGVGLGLLYAQVMLYGLRTWWVAAISTPFLNLYVTPRACVLGLLCGWFTALAVMAWSLWGLLRIPAKDLISGAWQGLTLAARRASGWMPGVGCAACIVGAGFLAAQPPATDPMAQAGKFFGAGFLILLAGLCAGWIWFVRPGRGKPSVAAPLPFLAKRGMARRLGRSLTTLGLVAMATFVIIAMGAFQLPPQASGSGGYALYARLTQPLLGDLTQSAAWEDLGVNAAQAQRLAARDYLAFRLKPGDDASCLNLYAVNRPSVLGVPQPLVEGTRQTPVPFAFAAAKAVKSDNPWSALQAQLPNDEAGRPIVPLILDAATAQYSLKLFGLGSRYKMQDSLGKPVTLEVVGFLSNSVFQGSLLIPETEFRRLFPEVAGRGLLLVQASAAEVLAISAELEAALPEQGLDVESSTRRLQSLLAVQNTYLQTFQSLGALGLLLGTLGLAAVQLRNVWERRREFALMQVLGFPRSELGTLVWLENWLLLGLGLLLGAFAAACALFPQWRSGQAVIPWGWLAVTFASVLIFGQLAGLVAVRLAVSGSLLSALRKE